ncbi:hypothetical protein P9112_008739 [Eukaryota sp. TZLM1-RC]
MFSYRIMFFKINFLAKSIGGVRPIAIGGVISRLLSTLGFNRIKKSAKEFPGAFQVGKGIYDGMNAAALGVDLFMNLSKENVKAVTPF